MCGSASSLTDDDSLRSLLRESLAGGGCAGVVCSTVTRAQRAYEILAQEFGENVVSLDHARFIDFDRMAHERRLRERLGPRATLANGGRPHLSIVVGTQVLEQSLDIDFDLLVTDVAPVDLFMQRLGRVHRHARGAEEGERPARLRMATCYMRGVKTWESGAGPAFSRSVYDEASLIECLAILGLDGPRAEVTLRLPDAIAQSVEAAYGPEAVRYIPSSWHAQYEEAIEGREAGIERKISRARACLLPSVEDMCRNERTLTDWYDSKLDVPVERSRLLSDDDRGPRAVRDTPETVEVLLVHKEGECVRLLPWVGDAECGIEPGSTIPTDEIPPDSIAKLATQCSVRLPQSLCGIDRIDRLIEELEEGCGRWIGAWFESEWLAGRLAIALETKDGGPGGSTLHAQVMGHDLWYSKEEGLVVRRSSKDEDGPEEP